MLSELAACHPDLELELRAENRLQDPINDGVDFCIRSRNVHDDRLVAKPLGFVWEAPYASPDYLAKAPPLETRTTCAATASCSTAIMSMAGNGGWKKTASSNPSPPVPCWYATSTPR
jgi:DNA-binding transcriptional LysR family regulator